MRIAFIIKDLKIVDNDSKNGMSNLLYKNHDNKKLEIMASSLIKISSTNQIFSVPFGPYNIEEADQFEDSQFLKKKFPIQGGG